MLNNRLILLLPVLFAYSSLNWDKTIETPSLYPSSKEIPASGDVNIATAAKPPIQVMQAEQIYSPQVSQIFYEVGYELANSKDISQSEIEQAILLLTAAMNLDSSAVYIRPLLIKLMCQSTMHDHSEKVYYSLEEYVDGSADLEIVRYAIQYLLEQLDSREEREILLKAMLMNPGDKNSVLRSELATLIGFLMAEKPDLESAKFYLVQAYSDNKYNKLAFEKLTEIMPEHIGPAVYLEQMRLTLRENPSDIETALALAEYAERLGLYETAGGIYRYCADLYGYLYPSEPLPARIYLPMAISYYNTERSKHKCIEIAAELRQKGLFDLLLESIAGKAAMKLGDTEQANRIFESAEYKAQQLLQQGPRPGANPLWALDDSSTLRVNATQFAWFYCFVMPDEQKALDWANKAYSTEPNSPATASLLAYSLMTNGQIEWAKPLISNYDRNQIADLTHAQIQLKEGQKGTAISTLKSVITKDPGSLEAEYAKELLAQQNAEYASPFEPNFILNALKSSFGQTFVPSFIKPEEIISVQLSIRGNEFSYGSEIDGTVIITNNSPEPFVISDDGLLRGNIRIDAKIRGDLQTTIPNLISRKIGTAFLIEPGRSILTPVRLVTGQLRQILLAHPQASLELEFTLYIDPVTTEQGNVTNRLTYIEPTRVLIRRSGVELTGKYMRNRFNSIATGRIGQKNKIAQLFVGLLLEQQAMANRMPLYRHLYADWMPTMLKSALIHESGLLRNPADDEWLVKVHTMAHMQSFALDQEMTRAVAENLNHTRWPVRMMALYLLAQNADGQFGKVLDWTAANDSNKLVRDMAAAIIAGRPQSPEPAELSTPDEFEGLIPILE